jgi:ketosteroid isomerase-like protein
MNDESGARFDFPAFKRAFVAQDVSTWLEFYADDAEWIEYKQTHPPRSPRRIVGKKEIAEFLAHVTASNVLLEIDDEIIGPTRAAFCLWCTLSDGRRIVEHIIIHFAGGKITRQVDVEAWD